MKKEFKDWLATPVNESYFVSDILSGSKPLLSAEIAFNYAYQLRQAEADALRLENERLRNVAGKAKELLEAWDDPKPTYLNPKVRNLRSALEEK